MVNIVTGDKTYCISNKFFCLLVGVLLLSVAGFVVTAYDDFPSNVQMHGADQVWIVAPDGEEMTFQQAIDEGQFTQVEVGGVLSGEVVEVGFTGGDAGGTTCVVTNDDKVSCSGRNGDGQLALGDKTTRTSFSQISSLDGKNIVEINGGNLHFYALSSDGTLYGWGKNNNRELGQGDTGDKTVPVEITTNVAKMAVRTSTKGYDYACALLNSGTVECWGYNGYGQLGVGDYTTKTTPTAVSGLSGVIDLKLGGHSAGGHACALTSGGDVYCWGYNAQGQLGLGDKTKRNIPTKIANLNADSIWMGHDDQGVVCAILASGAVQCWGENGYNQLGLGGATDDRVDKLSPQAVSGLDGSSSSSSAERIVMIGAGGEGTTCALLEDDTVSCWGANSNGQLGRETFTAREWTPEVVHGLSDVKDIVGFGWGDDQYASFCALTNGGSVYCWGDNNHGQLGQGDKTRSAIPLMVGISGVEKIFESGQSSGHHYCAIQTGGLLKCWGWNGYGGLGTGNKVSSLVPIAPI